MKQTPPIPVHAQVRGPGLWAFLYGALWLNGVALAALVYLPREGVAGVWPVLGWTAALGVTAMVSCANRIAIHDLLVSLSERDRLCLGLVIAIIFCTPFFTSQSHYFTQRLLNIFSHGFLYAAPAMMLIAAKAPLTRRFLAWTLLGAWFAAARVSVDNLFLPAIFGLSWLIALGATHYAYTGDPHGLTGWWPVRQVLRHALAAAVPAFALGALAWWLWPAPMAAGPAGAARPTPTAEPQRLIDQMDRIDLIALIWRGGVSLIVTAVLFMFLIYLRRWLLKGQRMGKLGDLLPDQQARMEYEPETPKAPAPSLPGLRGHIIASWGRWAGALEREGLGRRVGETAAQYAERLRAEDPSLSPPAAMTEILEKAHYGPEEPDPADLEAMREHVREGISRLSLKAQKPIEGIENE